MTVGAYLSGGLDSSLISALARREIEGGLETFSVAFRDRRYDERTQQEAVARALGTRHHVVEVGARAIAEALPEVVWHAETPLVRTAPVPLFLLSREVNARGIKVVITGEGADELFWGYDLFKEVALRELHRSDPERARRLARDLYPYLGPAGARRGPVWQRFLLDGAASGDPLSSHLTRARATATLRGMCRRDLTEAAGDRASLERLRAELPSGFEAWSALERAGWLEIKTLLEPYLLAAQGDRVAMAHAVEGRFPFLDHNVFSRAARLPANRKLHGLRDKVALRELAADLLPSEIAGRAKQPYRAPEVEPFFSDQAPHWVEERLSARALSETAIWDPGRVAALLRRCRSGRARTVREGMALVGVLSGQLWHEAFCQAGAGSFPAETAEPRVRVDRSGSRCFERTAV